VVGRYLWVPFHRIRRLDIEPATDLRDLVWVPAHFEWVNGGEAVGLVPTRYPGTESAESDALRLARRTEWDEVAPDTFHGIGQRMLATDGGEVALLDVARIDFGARDAGA
jgi:type VI secretion system protein ImpE